MAGEAHGGLGIDQRTLVDEGIGHVVEAVFEDDPTVADQSSEAESLIPPELALVERLHVWVGERSPTSGFSSHWVPATTLLAQEDDVPGGDVRVAGEVEVEVVADADAERPWANGVVHRSDAEFGRNSGRKNGHWATRKCEEVESSLVSQKTT